MEYVISDLSTSFYLFAVVECNNNAIKLGIPFEGSSIKRSELGTLAVVIDLFIVFIYLLFLWSVSYLVKIDAERHKKLLYETSEFSITVSNFPKLDHSYHII